jgi:hypothetical protein
MSIKNLYWSRNPGEFVRRETGEVVTKSGLVMSHQEWYETFVQEIALHVHLPMILTSLDVNSILENSVHYKPVYLGAYPEDVFLGPAKMVGEIHGKAIWVDEQMDSNILHLFFDKETFDKERVSFHVIGIPDFL